MNKKWLAIKELVDKQAEDEGLWFMARTAPEAYLQQELRRLHAEIEKQLPCDHKYWFKCRCGENICSICLEHYTD